MPFSGTSSSDSAFDAFDGRGEKRIFIDRGRVDIAGERAIIVGEFGLTINGAEAVEQLVRLILRQ